MEEESKCPLCHSQRTIKSGKTRHGKPRRKCKDCGRQYTIDPSPVATTIPQETWDMVERMFREGVGTRAIARITGISYSWICVKVARFVREVDQSLQPPENLDAQKKTEH